MTKHNYLQKDYTTNEGEYQVKLPFATEIKIEKDDPVRLLSHYVEEMDLSDLYSTTTFKSHVLWVYEQGIFEPTDREKL